jgi:hypothetical protein
MKVKINLRDYLEANAGSGISVQAHIDTDDILEALDLPDEDEFDIDIHEVLAENHVIGHLWGIEDVQEVRPDLNDDQAWQVLQAVERRLDSQYGMNWDTIEIIADELFGPKAVQRWQGRIDVAVEGYDRDEAIEHFTDLASNIEKAAVNATTRATFDTESLRCPDLSNNAEAEEKQP